MTNPLPKGTSIIVYPSGSHRARCSCDWTGPLRAERREAVRDCADHADRDAWCYIRARRLELEASARDVARATGEPVPITCGCGWDNAGRLVLVDRYAHDSPPGPRGNGDWCEVYLDDCLDPDDRLSDCPECGGELDGDARRRPEAVR